jgi:flagellar motor switch protein FliN
MMTDDGGLLSQDEIDMLTKGLGLGGPPPAADTAAAPTENTAEVARPFMKIICEQSSSVVTTVLSRAVDFQLQWLVAGENAVIPDELAGRALFLKVTFRKDLTGTLAFAISKPEIAILADLMLMGSGNSDYSDEHKDAIQEIVNQVMGSVITTLDSQLHASVEIGQSEAVDFSGIKDIRNGGVGTVALRVEGFPDQKVLLYLDDALMQSIKARSTAGSSAAMDTSLSSLGIGSGASTTSASASASAPVSAGSPLPPPPVSAPTPMVGGGPFGSTGNKALDLLMDIELPIVIELGRTQMSLKRILEIGPGAIVEMDRLAGEPVDILINGKVVARGEVVVVDENFGVRIISLVTPEERIKLLR